MKINWLTLIVALMAASPALAQEPKLGLPECELIVGTNRYIEIGNTISYTIEYLENNKYNCDEFRGKAHEIVSCTYSANPEFEVLLVVDDGIVTDIETFQNGLECTYFNIKPLDPQRLDNK
ncbi:MAG: hypothetical protein PVJ39_06155 [Gammaproteobacteria bacterium]